jgi:hypothetical protein
MKCRPGFALAAALACIVIIAVLASAALFASTQEAQATRTEVLDHQASSYAERSALLAVSGWSCAGCDSLAVGGVIVQNPAADPPLESTVYLTRLDSALFLVVAEGRIVVGGAARVKRRISIAVGTSRDSSGVTRAAPLSAQSWSAVFQM